MEYHCKITKLNSCRFYIPSTNECDYVHDCEHKKTKKCSCINNSWDRDAGCFICDDCNKKI
jgi:hypothetical protein